jgi:hypothetical protein
MEGYKMIDPLVEHLGKAMLAEAYGDYESEGMHLELAVQLAEDESTDTILECQEEAIRLIEKGEIKWNKTLS